MDYEKLKSFLDKWRQDHAEQQRLFFEALEAEVDQVERSFLQKQGKAQYELHQLKGGVFEVQHGTNTSHRLYIQSRLRNLSHFIDVLEKNFVSLNRTAIAKILKKHDKMERAIGGIEAKDPIIQRISQKRAFWNAPETSLSFMHSELRRLDAEMRKSLLRLAQN